MADLQAMAEALIRGDRNTVVELTQQAIDEGVSPKQVLNDGLLAGMNVVGKRFKANEGRIWGKAKLIKNFTEEFEVGIQA